MTKLADVEFGRPEDKHLSAIGIFVGGKKGHDHKAALDDLQSLFAKKGTSFQDVRKKYEKDHPEKFVTMAYSYSPTPVKDVGIYMHSGITGGADQTDFYHAVANHGKKK